MTSRTKVGIWMDHSSAHVMEFTTDPMETTIIESGFTHQEREESLNKGENLMHNKEQHQHSKYYKTLGEIIRKYEEVVLFGPTNAKQELFNLIKEDHLFAKIKIEIKPTDKMSNNQQYAFVRDYFLKS